MKQGKAKAGSNGRIFRTAVVVSLCLALVKIVGLAKELVVAGVFGRSDELEAFLIAFLVPGLLINLVAESMSQSLMPAFVNLKEKCGTDKAKALFSTAMFWNAALLVAISLAMACSARAFFPLIGSHFTHQKLDLATKLFYGMQPVVVLTGIASLCSAVLNAEGEFAIPAIAPAVTSLALIVVVPLLAGKAGAWSMVSAMLAGALIHVGWMLHKVSALGYPAWARAHGVDENMREVAQQFGPLLLSGLVASGGLVVDQAMAASLPAGSVAALAYAGRFVSVALALLGGSLSSAITPVFSELVARREWGECKQTVRLWVWRSFVSAAVLTGALIAGSRMLVRMTLQHGAFGAHDSQAVTSVLVMYALQIPFFVSSRVFYRLLVAIRRTDLVLYCGVLNLALDVAFNLLLMRRLGVAGIALATSLWTISTFLFLWYWSTQLLAENENACAEVAAG